MMIMYLLWLQSYKHFPKVPNKSRKKIEFCSDVKILKVTAAWLPPFCYRPMQDVAPRAVRIADAIDAMICTIHFRVSFLVIVYLLP